jgi:hypothetical protein
MSLGYVWSLRPTAELGVDHLDAKIDGNLNDSLPGAYRGLSQVLIGPYCSRIARLA